jgi:cytochrome c peroxidase
VKTHISRLFAATLATALAGCGGGGTGPADASTSPGLSAGAPAPAPAPAPSPAPGPAPASTPAVSAALTLNLASLDNYAAPALPAYYDGAVAATDNTPAGDPVNDRIATLGRVLFYDKSLSVNDAVACASCHQQSRAFEDDKRFSVGFTGTAFTTAHAMRLGNIRYYRPGSAFWDKRAASVEAQATQPVQNPVEMGFDAPHGGLGALLPKLQALPYYAELFSFAFGDSTVTEPRIQRALAQFERSMVSVNSRWDAAYALVYNPALPDKGLSVAAPGFSAEEERGRSLFVTPPQQGGLGCVGCHVPPTFALAANSRSNGLDAGETTVFKSPSLKGVAQSSAFMHDGRFATLAQVVEHYNSGVQAGPALDNRLTAPNGAPRRLNLSAADKAAVVAFLRTLDDTALGADAKFSSPFKP